jgi:hypothetical protein
MFVLCGRLIIRPLDPARSTPMQEVSQELDCKGPACIRLNYQLLLRATRPADTDRAVRTLLGSLEPTDDLASDIRRAFRDLADYNPLGQFGAAAARNRIR